MKSNVLIGIAALGAVGVVAFFIFKPRNAPQTIVINKAAEGNTLGGVLGGVGELASGISDVVASFRTQEDQQGTKESKA